MIVECSLGQAKVIDSVEVIVTGMHDEGSRISIKGIGGDKITLLNEKDTCSRGSNGRREPHGGYKDGAGVEGSPKGGDIDISRRTSMWG